MMIDEAPASTSFTESTEPKENHFEKDVADQKRQHQGAAVASKREASATYMEQMRRLDERITQKTANSYPTPPPCSNVQHTTTDTSSSSTVADHLRQLDLRIAQKAATANLGAMQVLPFTKDTIKREKGFTLTMMALDNSLSMLNKDHEKQSGAGLSILDGSKSPYKDGDGSSLGDATSGGGTRNQNNHTTTTSDMETGGGSGRDDGDEDDDDSDLHGLAIAVAVKDGEEGDVPAAIEFDPDSKPIPSKVLLRRYRIRAAMMVGGVVALLVIAVGLSVTFTTKAKNDRKDDTTLTTLPPTTYRESSGIQDQVEKVVGSEKLRDPTSPCYQALQWILHDDPRQLGEDDPSLLQRYLHVLFYISTTQKTPWASCNPPSSSYAPPSAWAVARNTTTNSKSNGTMNDPQDNLDDDDHADDFDDGAEEDDSCLLPKLQTLDPVPTYLGVPATRWLTQHHECTWAGVVCDDLDHTRELRLCKWTLSMYLVVILWTFTTDSYDFFVRRLIAQFGNEFTFGCTLKL
jgi:hypothetical protein